MHQKIKASIELNYPDDSYSIYNQVILTIKNVNPTQVEVSLIEFLANGNFNSEHGLYDFQYETTTDQIKEWLKTSKEEHPKLTIKDPIADKPLQIGTFKSDHKYAGYGILFLTYERRYLENE